MSFFARFVRDCWTVVIPLLLVMVASLVLFGRGQGDTAGIVANLGTFLVMLGNVVYVVFVHSRRRWPGANWRERFVRLFTFQK